jgi:hypothetical protein
MPAHSLAESDRNIGMQAEEHDSNGWDDDEL